MQATAARNKNGRGGGSGVRPRPCEVVEVGRADVRACVRRFDCVSSTCRLERAAPRAADLIPFSKHLSRYAGGVVDEGGRFQRLSNRLCCWDWDEGRRIRDKKIKINERG